MLILIPLYSILLFTYLFNFYLFFDFLMFLLLCYSIFLKWNSGSDLLNRFQDPLSITTCNLTEKESLRIFFHDETSFYLLLHIKVLFWAAYKVSNCVYTVGGLRGKGAEKGAPHPLCAPSLLPRAPGLPCHGSPGLGLCCCHSVLYQLWDHLVSFLLFHYVSRRLRDPRRRCSSQWRVNESFQ